MIRQLVPSHDNCQATWPKQGPRKCGPNRRRYHRWDLEFLDVVVYLAQDVTNAGKQ
jgi:hypothetical protein